MSTKNKSSFLNVPIRPEVKDYLQSLADREGLSLAAVTRRAIIDGVQTRYQIDLTLLEEGSGVNGPKVQAGEVGEVVV